MIKFRPGYFILTIIIFIIEVLIAFYVHDNIIRPYIGDLLVVVLIYCFVRSFLNFSVRSTAIGVLLFAFLTEMLQAFHVVNLLGLQHNKLARIIIGTSFSWADMACYTAGIIVVLLAEKKRMNHPLSKKS